MTEHRAWLVLAVTCLAYGVTLGADHHLPRWAVGACAAWMLVGGLWAAVSLAVGAVRRWKAGRASQSHPAATRAQVAVRADTSALVDGFHRARDAAELAVGRDKDAW